MRFIVRTAELNQLGAQHGSMGINSDGRLEPVTDVNDFYDELDRSLFGIEDPETVVDFGDMTRALGLILRWVCEAKTITLVGARTASSRQ
jgi:hypothetical protein